MDPQTARIVAYAIASVGAVIWLVGLRCVVKTFGRSRPGVDDGVSPVPPQGCITGQAEIVGRPYDLANTASLVLARDAGGLGPLMIVERRDDRLSFRCAGPAAADARVYAGIREGQLRFSPMGGSHTVVDYAIDVRPARSTVYSAVACQILGLIALVGGLALITALVIPSAHPAVRGQAVQMVQVIHFLWPPFLFCGLYRRSRRALDARFRTLVNNLPYYERQTATV